MMENSLYRDTYQKNTFDQDIYAKQRKRNTMF